MQDNLEVFFGSVKEIDFDPNVPVLIYAFEEQPDAIVSALFPEVDIRRKSVDKRTRKGDPTNLMSIIKDGKPITIAFVYIQYPWKKQKTFNLRSINFFREVMVQTTRAVELLRKEGFRKISVLLPGRFTANHIKEKINREYLSSFVKTAAEAVVYANNTCDELLSSPDVKLKQMTFLFPNDSRPSLDIFLRSALNEGSIIGQAVAFTRKLIELPINTRPPERILEEVLGKKIDISAAPNWQRFPISECSYARVLYGLEALRNKGFGLIAAVGQGSQYEPYIIELHYKPKTQRQKRIARIAITAKGVNFDTGGLDLKLTGHYDNMNFDIGGAATVLGAFKIAEVKNLPVELIAVIPVVENAIGPKAILPFSVVRSYNGKTVEISNTDAEGRLLMADAIAYADKELHATTILTVATLCVLQDFGPDFLKVVATTPSLERKAKKAEMLSSEKIAWFPHPEYLNHVDDMHIGTKSDLISDPEVYHTSPTAFMYNFFSKQPIRWLYIDVGVIFEKDAGYYGAGPGFGVKFLWHLLEQFS